MVKKMPGWEERGNVTASLVAMHTQMRKVFEGLGLGPEAIDWSVNFRTANLNTPFAEAIKEIAMQYHEQRLVTKWRSPSSVEINTAVAPLQPYPEIRNLVHDGAPLMLTLGGDGDLWANGRPIELHEVTLSLFRDKSPRIGEVFRQIRPDLHLEGLNMNLSFFLRRHRELVPQFWKLPRGDGYTPHIVLPGTTYSFDQHDVVSAMSWDEHAGEMTDSWTDTRDKLTTPSPHSSWHPHTGLKPRDRIYIAHIKQG